MLATSSNITDICAERGNDLLKIMHPVTEWPGKTGQWQRGEDGGCIQHRLIKSSDRSDEQQADNRVEEICWG